MLLLPLRLPKRFLIFPFVEVTPRRTACVARLAVTTGVTAATAEAPAWTGETGTLTGITAPALQVVQTPTRITPLPGKYEWRETGPMARGMTASGWPASGMEKERLHLRKAGAMPVPGQTMSGTGVEHSTTQIRQCTKESGESRSAMETEP